MPKMPGDLDMDNFDFDEFFAQVAVIEAKSEERANELFGDSDGSDFSDEECDIIFSDIPHEDKLAKLRNIRAEKTVKPKSFAKRMTKAGRISARGMGIKLD